MAVAGPRCNCCLATFAAAPTTDLSRALPAACQFYAGGGWAFSLPPFLPAAALMPTHATLPHLAALQFALPAHTLLRPLLRPDVLAACCTRNHLRQAEREEEDLP